MAMEKLEKLFLCLNEHGLQVVFKENTQKLFLSL